MFCQCVFLDFQLLPDPCCIPLHLFSLAQTTMELKNLVYNFLPIHPSNESGGPTSRSIRLPIVNLSLVLLSQVCRTRALARIRKRSQHWYRGKSIQWSIEWNTLQNSRWTPPSPLSILLKLHHTVTKPQSTLSCGSSFRHSAWLGCNSTIKFLMFINSRLCAWPTQSPVGLHTWFFEAETLPRT